MKKKFLKAGAVITALSLTAGLPGANTVMASEETVKKFSYEGKTYFYTLNEEDEIVWTAESFEETVEVPPFVMADADPLKEEDLPKTEAEPTVKLIVTEITPEPVIFTEEEPAPETHENENTLPDIAPTVIPEEESLPDAVPAAEIPEEEAPSADAEEAAPEENASESAAKEEAAPLKESVPAAEPAVREGAAAAVPAEEADPEEEAVPAEETVAVEETVAAEEPAPDEKKAEAGVPAAKPAESAAAEDAKAAEPAENVPAEEAKAAEPAENVPAEEAKAAEPAENVPAEDAKAAEPAESAAAEEASAGETVPEGVIPAATEPALDEEEPAETPVPEKADETASGEEAAEEENPLLALGKQEMLMKYDNLLSGSAAEATPAEEEEDVLYAAEAVQEAGSAETEESEDALISLARQETGTDVDDIPFATETWTPGNESVIPAATETLDTVSEPAFVTSVDETVVNAAPGTKQIVGDTDAAGSKTLTAAPTPTAAPTAAPTAVPTPTAAPATAAPAENTGSVSPAPSTETPAKNANRANPKTGDISNPFAYVAAMIASGAAFFTAKRKKRD